MTRDETEGQRLMNFLYEAIDTTGQTVLGKIDATDATEAQRKLLQMGYRPQSLAPTAAVAPINVTTMPGLPVADRTVAGVRLPTPTPSAQHSAPNTQYRTPDHLNTQYPASNLQVSAPSQRTGGITLAGNAAHSARQNKTTGPQSPATSHQPPTTSSLGGVSTRDLMLFFQQLASLVKSGMTIYTALENLAPRTANKNLSQVAREMAQAAHRGDRISDVMAHYPIIFPEHIIGTVRAGELGGFLEIVLAEIALNYEQNIALYRGSWIPKFMTTQAFFMIPFVQPLFGSLFRVTDGNLDFAANLALYFQLVFLRNLPIAFLLYFGVKWGARRLQLPQFRRKRDEWSLRVPPFGDLQRQVALSTFVRMLRRLYRAGVAPIQAWEGAMNTSSNVVIRDQLAASYSLMQQGVALPEAFQATGLFNNSIEQLMVTGHHSGEIENSLDQAASFYQEQAEESAKKARFAMLRYGILAMMVFGGAAMIWLAKTYFGGMFSAVESMFPEVYGGG
jgi:type IV pilus assembly protein PilC